MTIALLGIIFLLALIFTWTNGVHQGSAVAASSFASHSLTRKQAMILICVFEILGTIFGGSAVASMIQSLTSYPEERSLLPILASALGSAIVWNVVANKVKMPASSTHALIGGIIGSVFASDWNFSHIQMGTLDPVHPTGLIGAVISLFLSPTLGFILSYIIFCLLLLCTLRASFKMNERFRKAQWFSVAALAFGDGQNDTQKTMGLLMLALNAAGQAQNHDIPLWMRLVVGLVMGIGAFSISSGLVKELAFKVYKIRPVHAVAAETSSAVILVANSLIGGPVSASQVIAASIMGNGAAERCRGINWLSIKDIALSWVVTIPASAVIAVLIELILFRWTTAWL